MDIVKDGLLTQKLYHRYSFMHAAICLVLVCPHLASAHTFGYLDDLIIIIMTTFICKEKNRGACITSSIRWIFCSCKSITIGQHLKHLK